MEKSDCLQIRYIMKTLFYLLSHVEGESAYRYARNPFKLEVECSWMALTHTLRIAYREVSGIFRLPRIRRFTCLVRNRIACLLDPTKQMSYQSQLIIFSRKAQFKMGDSDTARKQRTAYIESRFFCALNI